MPSKKPIPLSAGIPSKSGTKNTRAKNILKKTKTKGKVAKKTITKKPVKRNSRKASKTKLAVKSKKKKTALVRQTKVLKKKPVEKITEPITFGLLEEEMEKLIQEHLYEKTQLDVEKKVFEDLARLLPDNEPIVTSKSPQKNNSAIEYIRNRHKHSPYVLDLTKMVENKRQQAINKNLIQEKINTRLSQRPHIIRQEKETQIIISDNEIKKQFTTKTIYNFEPLFKPALAFALICFAIILPIKAFTYYKEISVSKENVIQSSNQAYQDLKIAGQAITNQDADLALEKFNTAKINFERAQKDLDSIDSTLQTILSIIPTSDKYLTDAKRLTLIGEKVSEIGTNLTELTAIFGQLNATDNLTTAIEQLRQKAIDISPKVTFIAEQVQLIDPQILPVDKQEQFVQLKAQILTIQESLEETISFSAQIIDILGNNYTRRYLFVFQNNNEIRATGGFLGSFALVDIKNGKIEKIEMPGGGTYDMQGSLIKNIEPPYPLQLINERWEFQDSNWFFDFPTTARKIQWFYEKAGGPSVDGVIAINATFVQKILTHTEPIYLPEYGKTITAENFIDEIQKSVELEYDKQENKPKQILADMAPILIEQIFDKNKTDMVALISEFKNGLQEKEIQMYFNNQLTQERISSYDWSGEIKSSSKDYLAVVNTNIAGQKTDGKIEQTINHTSEIQADGSIIDTLIVTRKHLGNKGELFNGVRNVNFMRIYVPQGSQLLSVEGFEQPALELFEEIPEYAIQDKELQDVEQNKKIDSQTNTQIYNVQDKTVFGNWTQTDPGETSTIKITYKLPFQIKINTATFWQKMLNNTSNNLYYSVFYQKQPGIQNSSVNSEIILPKNFQINWAYPSQKEQDSSYIQSFEQNKDFLSGIIIEKID